MSSLDRFALSIFTPSEAVASSTTAQTVTLSVIPPPRPEQGFHSETKFILREPTPGPVWGSPLHYQRTPIDLIVPAAAAGVAVAWHIRRKTFERYVEPPPADED